MSYSRSCHNTLHMYFMWPIVDTKSVVGKGLIMSCVAGGHITIEGTVFRSCLNCSVCLRHWLLASSFRIKVHQIYVFSLNLENFP